MTQDLKNGERLRAFAENLKALCSQHKSVSFVARETGINRQQFEKYLRGKSMPSPFTQRKIAEFFGVMPQDLFDDARIERELKIATPAAPAVFKPFPEKPSRDELVRLRNYTGIYNAYFISPAAKGMIHVGAAMIHEKNFQILSSFFIRSRSPETNIVHRSQLIGTLLLRGERIYLLEHSKKEADRFSQTIFLPAHGDKAQYLMGMSVGLTWRPTSQPFASRTIWKKAAASATLMQAISRCGFHKKTDLALDPVVRKFFASERSGLSMSGNTDP